MDLSELDTTAACDKGAEMELKHPVTDEPLGAFISILGSDSKAFQDYMERIGNEARRKQFIADKSRRPIAQESIANSKAEATALLVAMTTGWRGVEYRGNPVFPFTVENATKLYNEQLWIKRQVDGWIVDLGNFMPG